MRHPGLVLRPRYGSAHGEHPTLISSPTSKPLSGHRAVAVFQGHNRSISLRSATLDPERFEQVAALLHAGQPFLWFHVAREQGAASCGSQSRGFCEGGRKTQQAFLGTKSAIWTELKPVLASLSDGKCWYTEAKDRVSYWEVDHFRPKKVYPWLAFDWANFRLCGANPIERKPMSFHSRMSPAAHAPRRRISGPNVRSCSILYAGKTRPF